MDPAENSSRQATWLSFALGVVCVGVGLAPWLLSGARLPLQNLWATQTLPDDMPRAMLPISQYHVVATFALLVAGAAMAGVAARLLQRRFSKLSVWHVWTGVLLAEVIAIAQSFWTLGLGLGLGDQQRHPGPAAAYFAGMLVVTLLAAGLGMVSFWALSRTAAASVAVGAGLAVAPFSSLAGSWISLSPISYPVSWIAYLLLGIALGLTGWQTKDQRRAWIVTAAVVIIAPALVAALSMTLASARTSRGDLLDMARHGMATLAPAAGAALLPLLLALLTGAAITVGRQQRAPRLQ